MGITTLSFLKTFLFKLLKCIVTEQSTLGLTDWLARLLWLIDFLSNRLLLRSIDFIKNLVILSKIWPLLTAWKVIWPWNHIVLGTAFIEFLQVRLLFLLTRIFKLILKAHFDCAAYLLDVVVYIYSLLFYRNRFLNQFLHIFNGFHPLGIRKHLTATLAESEQHHLSHHLYLLFPNTVDLFLMTFLAFQLG